MNSDTLTTLFRHNLWANEQLLAVCVGLSDEQLDATVVGTFGTIRETLEHIVKAERSYFSRISTGQRYSGADTALTLAEMLELTKTTGQGLIEWAPKVQPTDTVQVNWDGAMLAIPCTVILTQAINHATEHRAQIMAILTQLGIQPPELDGWSYFISHKG